MATHETAGPPPEALTDRVTQAPANPPIEASAVLSPLTLSGP